MYNEKDFLSDFITRTLKNLEYIKTSEKQGEKVYEITQVVNSCLGLIVLNLLIRTFLIKKNLLLN